VLGDEHRLDSVREAPQFREMHAVECIGRAERHPDAVQRQRVVRPQIVERGDSGTAVAPSAK